MWTALKIAAYLPLVAFLAFIGYSAWFASVWGFSPLFLLPIYLLGLMVCGGVVFVVHYCAPRKPAAN